MKITPETSALMEKVRYFWKPETSTIFLDLLRVNKVSVVGTGGLQEKICFFNIFTHICKLSPFHNIFYVKQIKNLSLRLK